MGSGLPGDVRKRRPELRRPLPYTKREWLTKVAAVEVLRAFADLGPVAVWLGGAMIGLMAVLVVYVGVVLVAALKAETPELQRYRSRLLRDLLRFIRDLCRGRGQR